MSVIKIIQHCGWREFGQNGWRGICQILFLLFVHSWWLCFKIGQYFYFLLFAMEFNCAEEGVTLVPFLPLLIPKRRTGNLWPQMFLNNNYWHVQCEKWCEVSTGTYRRVHYDLGHGWSVLYLEEKVIMKWKFW